VFQKILVPLDGAEPASPVLRYVEELARCTGAQIILLHVPVYGYEVRDDTPSIYGYAPLISAEQRHAAVRPAIQYLSQIRRQLAAQGFEVCCTVQDGPIAETILQVARERGADLIVMATHARSGLSRALFRSLTEGVLRDTKVPLLLIRLPKSSTPT
jgi:nucleotide-binding universal stress UspA family protein